MDIGQDMLGVPELALRLRATVDDEEVFPVVEAGPHPDGFTDDEIRSSLKEAFGALHETAAGLWGQMVGQHMEAAGVVYRGPVLEDALVWLDDYWIADFAKGILRIAEEPATDESQRRFLYFMMGVMFCVGDQAMPGECGESE